MPPELRRFIFWLLAGTLFLPIAVVLILAVARLLAALEDPTGAAALERLGLVLGIAWALAIVALVILLAIRSLLADEHQPEDIEERVARRRSISTRSRSAALLGGFDAIERLIGAQEDRTLGRGERRQGPAIDLVLAEFVQLFVGCDNGG